MSSHRFVTLPARRFLVIAFAATLSCWFPSELYAQPPAGQKVKVLVGFHQRPTQAEVNLIGQNGGQVTRRFSIINSVAADLPPAAVNALANHPAVKIIEPDLDVQADEYGDDWGIEQIGARLVHEGAVVPELGPVLGSGVRVAVIDTGIDYTHLDLLGVYAGGYDFVNNDTDPMDDQYHGTHCAGTIAATLDGAGVVGAAPEVSLYGLKVLGADAVDRIQRSSRPWIGVLQTRFKSPA